MILPNVIPITTVILIDRQIVDLCYGVVPDELRYFYSSIDENVPRKIRPMVDPFLLELVNPASLDIRVGETAKLRTCRKVYDGGEVYGWEDIDLSIFSPVNPYWMQPGDRLLVASLETFNLPDFLCAQFRLKSSRGREFYEHMEAGFCISGETMIPLLNGTVKPIKELVGTSQWVYSLDENGDIVAGKATNIRKTKSVNRIIRVWLDNGKFIETTPEHRYMLRDGSYTEASALTVGESLMPFYRKKWQDNREHVMCPGTKLKSNWKTLKGKYRPTHRLVAAQFLGEIAGQVIHHVDHNKNNNCPENLTIMGKYDHDYLHRVEYNQSEDGRNNASKNMKNSLSKVKQRMDADPEYAAKIKANRSRAAKIRNEKYWSNPENKVKQSQKLKQCANTNGARKWIEENKDEFNERVSQGIQSSKRNHKIVKIEHIEFANPMDVFDMTVDNFHNFATEEGVFLHNCDPGWHGSKLTMEIINMDVAPLPLYPGLKMGQLIFSLTLSTPENDYSVTGRYNGDRQVEASKG